MNNSIQIISNLDFDCQVNSHNLVTKNKNGEQIKNQTVVRVKNGHYEVYLI
jgi:hypothetical protein